MRILNNLFLLCCVILSQIFLSCSQEGPETVVSDDHFEAVIGNDQFFAKDVVLMLRGDYIDIVGNDLKNDRSIFITLKRSGENHYVFGNSSTNDKGNEAVLYQKNASEEYSTTLLNKTCGEVTLDISRWDEGFVSGKFHFEASDIKKNTVIVSNGKFEKTF